MITPKNSVTSPSSTIKESDIDIETKRLAFFVVKSIIVILNLIQILFIFWFLSMAVSTVNERSDNIDDTVNKDQLSLYSFNSTVLILSGVMGCILCAVGLIASLTESYSCIVAYSTVLSILFLSSLASLQPFDHSRILNIIIILTMTAVSVTYALMLRAREKQEEANGSGDLGSSRGYASHDCTALTV
jgi:hypothetical protein